jgi:hypothetical protein
MGMSDYGWYQLLRDPDTHLRVIIWYTINGISTIAEITETLAYLLPDHMPVHWDATLRYHQPLDRLETYLQLHNDVFFLVRRVIG